MRTASGRMLSGNMFHPLSIVWHSVWWAGDPGWSHPSDGSLVSSWHDATGNGHDASQGTGGNQPTYRASSASFNNKPAVDFTAGSRYLSVGAFTTLGSGPSAFSVVSVVKAGTTANNFYFSGCPTGPAGAIGVQSTPAWRLFNGSAVSAGTADTSPHFYSAIFNGASTKLIVGSTTYNPGSAGTSTVASYQLNGYTGAATGTDGLIAFLGLYDGDITAHVRWNDLKIWISNMYSVTT